jgi:hypothetical protein
MSSYVPNSLIDAVEKMMNYFWWTMVVLLTIEAYIGCLEISSQYAQK